MSLTSIASNQSHRILFLTFAVTVMLQPAMGDAQDSTDKLLDDARTHFDIISAPSPDELEKPMVELGRHLFWDKRLSANATIACASCHAAKNWGADSARFSKDARGKLTKRNSQTVFNSMLQPHLRWTGDRKSGAHQAENSLAGSLGFANADEVVALLEQHGYESKFQNAFPSIADPMSPANYAKAIEAYQATLTTPAAFDRYLTGQVDALSDEQKTGLQIFMDIGCADCHSGKLMGGESLEKFGVYHEYWTATRSDARDDGLFESTKVDSDRYQFRTSMLRNIEKTGPYFHDGSVANLSEAVRVMAKVQLDRDLEPEQIESIVAFLSSLTGEVPQNYSDPHTSAAPSINPAPNDVQQPSTK